MLILFFTLKAIKQYPLECLFLDTLTLEGRYLSIRVAEDLSNMYLSFHHVFMYLLVEYGHVAMNLTYHGPAPATIENNLQNTNAITPGQADKKPGASGRVFAITEGHAANTSEHHAMIDCRSYQVIFGDIHAPEFIYHGSLPGKSMQIISALQARTLLSHGCEGFLATIHDTTLEVPSIHDQQIVLEFPDVFPDELQGIPPVREVEFNIELIPGAEPISKAPYRMAPVELKELKDQLQELLERGF
nr:putative reverse transcriptase domain, aspartic peptidase domain protein [Tanacetum cinerariifolium]